MMTAINGFSPIGAPPASAASATGGVGDARAAAGDAVGTVGERVLAWVSAIAPGGGGGSAASGFRADPGLLSRGGDIYGLRALTGELSARFGATPTQEGDLTRALEGLTRAAMIEVAGLHGAAGDRQLAGIDVAYSAARSADAGGGIDGVTARLEAATDALSRRAG